MDYTHIHKKPFGKIILIKSLIYLISFVFVFAVIYLILKVFNIIPENINQMFLSHQISFHLVVLIMLFLVFFILITNFFLIVNRKFGPGNLWPIFLGKYHRPSIENRIFMFLDLRSSTAYAEKLGHLKYSRMIQDCFHDLNMIVRKYKADIYQYVGDEAVLTWREKDGLEKSNCLNLFFAFHRMIESKNKKYLKKYGLLPDFKAGMSCGEVSVAEVGDIKREIAYHGDVLNTGARIQSLCNSMNRNLLISAGLKEKLNSAAFTFSSIGNIKLKGKSKAIEIFDVEERND